MENTLLAVGETCHSSTGKSLVHVTKKKTETTEIVWHSDRSPRALAFDQFDMMSLLVHRSSNSIEMKTIIAGDIKLKRHFHVVFFIFCFDLFLFWLHKTFVQSFEWRQIT